MGMPLARCTLLLSHTSTSSPSQPQLLWLPQPQLLPTPPPQPSLTLDTPLPQLSLGTPLPQLSLVMPLPPQPTPAGPLAPQPLLPGRSTKQPTALPVPIIKCVQCAQVTHARHNIKSFSTLYSLGNT